MASPTGSRAPGLHTPTQSFSGSPADTLTPSQILNANEKKKLRDDVEVMKQRLTDQKFNIRDYPDPLLPRDIPREHHMPQGLTAQSEKHLLDVIAKVKASGK